MGDNLSRVPVTRKARRIYASYALYHQTADGTEQVIFDQTTGKGLPRCELMFVALLERFSLARRDLRR